MKIRIALRQLVRRTLQNFVRHPNPPEMVIDGLTYTRTGGLELVASHPGVAMLAAHLAAYFKAQGGINYVEFSAWNPELGELTFTVQRRDGETPAQQAARWKSCYHELIMAVGNKYDGESRHETALRYIRQAEAVGGTPCESNVSVLRTAHLVRRTEQRLVRRITFSLFYPHTQEGDGGV